MAAPRECLSVGGHMPTPGKIRQLWPKKKTQLGRGNQSTWSEETVKYA